MKEQNGILSKTKKLFKSKKDPSKESLITSGLREKKI